MKFHVTLEVPTEIGNRFEKQPGGPGPVLGRFLEEFKPEAAYFCSASRKAFVVVDLDSQERVGALALSWSHITGTYPTFDPVGSFAELGDFMPGVMEAIGRIVGE